MINIKNKSIIMYNKKIYDNLMSNISKSIKKSLYEGIDFNDLDDSSDDTELTDIILERQQQYKLKHILNKLNANTNNLIEIEPTEFYYNVNKKNCTVDKIPSGKSYLIYKLTYTKENNSVYKFKYNKEWSPKLIWHNYSLRNRGDKYSDFYKDALWQYPYENNKEFETMFLGLCKLIRGPIRESWWNRNIYVSEDFGLIKFECFGNNPDFEIDSEGDYIIITGFKNYEESIDNDLLNAFISDFNEFEKRISDANKEIDAVKNELNNLKSKLGKIQIERSQYIMNNKDKYKNIYNTSEWHNHYKDFLAYIKNKFNI